MDIISPSFKGFLLGIPCTTSSLTDTQRVFGKSYIPKKPGSPLLSRMNVSAILSSSNGTAPGSIWLLNSPKVLDTNLELCLINSISSSVL